MDYLLEWIGHGLLACINAVYRRSKEAQHRIWCALEKKWMKSSEIRYGV